MKIDPFYNEKYTDYQVRRSKIRSWVRNIYMCKAASLAKGVTLDFGCGIGDLLSKLPPGSVGLEYNPSTVSYANARGLEVYLYNGFADNWQLSSLPSDSKFQTLVISHVLEHLEQPFETLQALLKSAAARHITRVLIIVPGLAGFKIDKTHRFFLDQNNFRNFISTQTEWEIESMRFFPFNVRLVSEFFAHNELQVVLNRLVT